MNVKLKHINKGIICIINRDNEISITKIQMMQYPNIFMVILQRRGIIRIIQMELLEWVRNSLLGIWIRVPTHCSALQSILEKEGFFHANWCIVHSFYNSFSSLLTFMKCGCVQHFSSIKTSDFDRSWKCLPGLAVVLPRTPFLLPKLPPDNPATRSTSSKTKNPKHSNIYPASPLSSIPSPIPPTQKRKLSSTDTGPVPKSRPLASATCWRHVECARGLWPLPIRVRACCAPSRMSVGHCHQTTISLFQVKPSNYNCPPLALVLLILQVR